MRISDWSSDVCSSDLVVFVLFDVFGERMKSLGSLDVVDLAKGRTFPFSKYTSWYANENDVTELLVTVAFVSRARRKTGGVWEADLKQIQKSLDGIGFQVAADQLEITRAE